MAFKPFPMPLWWNKRGWASGAKNEFFHVARLSGCQQLRRQWSKTLARALASRDVTYPPQAVWAQHRVNRIVFNQSLKFITHANGIKNINRDVWDVNRNQWRWQDMSEFIIQSAHLQINYKQLTRTITHSLYSTEETCGSLQRYCVHHWIKLWRQHHYKIVWRICSRTQTVQWYFSRRDFVICSSPVGNFYLTISVDTDPWELRLDNSTFNIQLTPWQVPNGSFKEKHRGQLQPDRTPWQLRGLTISVGEIISQLPIPPPDNFPRGGDGIGNKPGPWS